jgi:serine/threonine-protein kinase
MGVVVSALHLELDQRVAVKFLLAHIASPEAVARFVREARAAVKIRSEHVARVIDVGRLDDGAPYMVMEYLEGRDLAAQLGHGPLSIEDAVDYVIQAADAMAEAHAEGIVHRDLKPANLFLTRRSDGAPVIKVLDFGISKLQTPDTEMSLTRTSAVMGSPVYMSPEQARAVHSVDARTDIWSLGIILFELLTGRTPFRGNTLPELITAIAMDAPQPLRQVRTDAPADLELAISRCLEKDRDRRFQHVGELVASLIPFAPTRSRPIFERVLKVTGVIEPTPTVREHAPPFANAAANPTGTAWGATGPQRGRSLGGLGIGLGGLAVVLALAAAYIARRPEAPSAPAPELASSPAAIPAQPSAVPRASPAQEPEVTPVPAPAASAPTPDLPVLAGAQPKTPTRAKAKPAGVATPAPAASAAARPEAPPAVEAVKPPPANPSRKRGLDIDLK